MLSSGELGQKSRHRMIRAERARRFARGFRARHMRLLRARTRVVSATGSVQENPAKSNLPDILKLKPSRHPVPSWTAKNNLDTGCECEGCACQGTNRRMLNNSTVPSSAPTTAPMTAQFISSASAVSPFSSCRLALAYYLVLPLVLAALSS